MQWQQDNGYLASTELAMLTVGDLEAGEGEMVEAVEAEDALTVADAPLVVVETAARLPTDDNDVHCEEEGAGCASGVEGSP